MKREGSIDASIIEKNMLAGTVALKEITIPILRSHMIMESSQATDLFILDGFPRNLEQAHLFEETVAPIELVIVLECPDTIMIERPLSRERFDDNLENIHKRLRTFHETTSEVVDWFRCQGKVKTINADDDVEAINYRLVELLKPRIRITQENGKATTNGQVLR
ncbi:P-loop containing nucleoside triphosphate hydrolase protein [Xylariaceae sp. FL1651]|nr:P-loop containing nucleoside triphosphate hydrolase protein [Xylariaceae sp. FL1651]